ncbi:hypothetical protein ACFQZQ_11600 [Lysobacter koreensis]|uniref:Lipoprotein n=1 Tax=Lysobacter koreensis TaxID=266122 RepID=A0ABW2YQ47_9GAMM
MKRAVLLTLLLAAGCSGPVLKTGHVPGWQTVTAAGGFMLALPRGLKAMPVQGIDSAVSHFQGSDLTLSTDHGEHGGIPDEQGWTRKEILVDGRRGILTRGRVANGSDMPFAAVAHFPQPAAPTAHGKTPSPYGIWNQSLSLTVTARCGTQASCDLGERAMHSLEFPESFPRSRE